MWRNFLTVQVAQRQGCYSSCKAPEGPSETFYCLRGAWKLNRLGCCALAPACTLAPRGLTAASQDPSGGSLSPGCAMGPPAWSHHEKWAQTGRCKSPKALVSYYPYPSWKQLANGTLGLGFGSGQEARGCVPSRQARLWLPPTPPCSGKAGRGKELPDPPGTRAQRCRLRSPQGERLGPGSSWLGPPCVGSSSGTAPAARREGERPREGRAAMRPAQRDRHDTLALRQQLIG